ncbi:MAG TPA: hypothetical protein VFP61_00225, partial [Acidimicrobiales bacterium]|nr:hypothetical protein [Acidimicrobiales bacterium]
QELTSAELDDREEFLLDNTLRNRTRSTTPEIWEHMGTSVEVVLPFLVEAAERHQINPAATFQHGFFAKLVPNVRKLGLLDPKRSHRLREQWGQAGLLQYEWADDTLSDYDTYDEVAKDRAAAGAR